MLGNETCAIETSAKPSTFRNQESTSKLIYKSSLSLHLSTHLPSALFPIKDNEGPLLTWLFGFCFPSSQQMCAKSKIRHPRDGLLSQKGSRKETQVVYKFIELLVTISISVFH